MARDRHGLSLSAASAAALAYVGRFEATIGAPAPMVDLPVRAGGRPAQRDVSERTLLAAHLRAGRHAAADARRRLRVDRRPSVPGARA